VGADTYYGWARLDVHPGSTSFTVKDYAYESTANACIQAGQTIVGIDENTTSFYFSIYPNPCISSTTIQTNYQLKNATLTICNSYGQTIKQIERISGHTISLSREDLPSGLYFIMLTEGNRVVLVDKMVIAD
jgi:Secretion system C-terminal sorting domain